MKSQKLIASAFVILTSSWALGKSAQDRHWLSYSPATVKLEGKLVMKRKYGLPNFGENPKTDAKVIVPILVLLRPVNVRGNPEDVLNSESVEDIREIQLRFYEVKVPYKRLVGRRIQVSGALSHAITGHQYTKVVMDVNSLEKTRRR